MSEDQSMKSPFPGMDPYLEVYWGDVNTSLVTYGRDQLRSQLPRDLRVHVEEHVTVQIADHEDPVRRGGFYPDVRVMETPGAELKEPTATGTTTLSEPLIVPLDLVPETQRCLQIVDTRSGHNVVTAIEFLSPWNKCGPAGRAAYRQKQKDFWDAGVNLVEIDLVREGQYVLAVPVHVLPTAYAAPYRIAVLRASRPEKAEVYRATLREPLPTIRVPLREADDDVGLNLQALLDKSYENGGYYDEIDYRDGPQPPFARDDAAWADSMLRDKGRR
jgi:hypothetical protein